MLKSPLYLQLKIWLSLLFSQSGRRGVLAAIAGAQGWEDIENYGLSKQQWLEEFLELPHGIPSDDTFRRVFEKLDPKVLEEKLSQWLQQIMGSVFQEIIPIDGKSLRGYYDREKGLKNLHLVTAWASGQRLVLGQVKVEDHSNEITAIPALLERARYCRGDYHH